MIETERNKQVIRDLLGASDAGDLTAIASCFSPGYVDHQPNAARLHPSSDFEGAMIAFRAFLAAFPDTRHTIHDLIAEGDRVVARISAEATHTGELFGLAPTGKHVSNDAIVIYRLVDGRIVERWSRENRSALDQLREAGHARAASARPDDAAID